MQEQKTPITDKQLRAVLQILKDLQKALAEALSQVQFWTVQAGQWP